MSRSLSKGYYVDSKLLKKVKKSFTPEKAEVSDENLEVENVGKKKSKKSKIATPGAIKTWARSSVIHPEMIGKSLLVHNGKEHKEIIVTSSMVGLKIGCLVSTRKGGKHGKAGKR